MKLLLPIESFDNSTNCAHCNAVFPCQHPIADKPVTIFTSYVSYQWPCQFGHSMFLAFEGYSAAFCNFVSGVFEVVAKKEVIRIAALRIIALVQHELAFWDLSKVNQPRCPVRQNMRCGIRTLANMPVTHRVFSSRPCPTPAQCRLVQRNRPSLSDLLPKSLKERFGKALLLKCAEVKFRLHSISSVDCLPRLRLFVQRAGTFVEFQVLQLRAS